MRWHNLLMWGSPLPHTGLHDEQVLALHLLEQGCQPTLLISKCLFQEMLHVVELRVARVLAHLLQISASGHTWQIAGVKHIYSKTLKL